jgi:hypothetical protein
MVSACVVGMGGRRVVVQELLQGSTRVADLLGCFCVQEGAEMFVYCNARLLKAKATLVEAGVAAGGMVYICVGKGGGMPHWQAAAGPDLQRIFAVSGSEGAGPSGHEHGLAEELGWLLHSLSEDVSEMEGAVLSLNLIFRSGQYTFVHV